MVRQFSLRGMLMVFLPTRVTVNSFMRWLGFDDHRGVAEARLLELMYLGARHFRVPVETSQVMPTVFSDGELSEMHVPTLLLIGDHEVISDPAKALARARRLITDLEGDLVPRCRHDMCVSQQLIDGRLYMRRPDLVEGDFELDGKKGVVFRHRFLQCTRGLAAGAQPMPFVPEALSEGISASMLHACGNPFGRNRMRGSPIAPSFEQLRELTFRSRLSIRSPEPRCTEVRETLEKQLQAELNLPRIARTGDAAHAGRH